MSSPRRSSPRKPPVTPSTCSQFTSLPRDSETLSQQFNSLQIAFEQYNILRHNITERQYLINKTRDGVSLFEYATIDMRVTWQRLEEEFRKAYSKLEELVANAEAEEKLQVRKVSGYRIKSEEPVAPLEETWKPQVEERRRRKETRRRCVESS